MSDRDKDRIRLAYAMGWRKGHIDYSIGARRWIDPKGVDRAPIPDPFTNPTDDYAVLEWMRKQRANSPMLWDRFCFALEEIGGTGCRKWNYQIGDYARTALKVLDDG